MSKNTLSQNFKHMVYNGSPYILFDHNGMKKVWKRWKEDQLKRNYEDTNQTGYDM